MSKKFTFELNEKGVAELLKGPEMQGVLAKVAAQKTAQAGPGYAYDVHAKGGYNRAVAHIYPADKESGLDNYENNTLLKVISG